MKILRFTLLIISIVSITQIQAQTSLEPFDSSYNYDKDQRPCIQLNIEPDAKTLKNAWKDYIKDNYDFKLKGIGFLSNKDLLSAEEVVIPKISSNTLDFYTHIVENDTITEMKIFVREGYDLFIEEETHPKEYAAIHKMATSFMKYYLPQYYEEKVTATEKTIEKLSKETSDLEEDILNDTQTIADLEKRIENLKENVITNKELLETEKGNLITKNKKLALIKAQLLKL